MTMLETLSRNLKRRRLVLGLDQGQLAERVEISRVAYCNIENGKAEPREDTLAKLCAALEISPFDLVKETFEPKALNFRIRKTLSARERACSEQTLADACQWLHDYCFLESEAEKKQGHNFLSTHERQANESIPEFALRVRKNVLADGRPIDLIGGILEERGVKLLPMPFLTAKCFGFSFGREDGGPAIVVNSNPDISHERQLFTLLHELGHLALHHDAYRPGFQDEDKTQEQEADFFAAHFLMPGDLFNKTWDANFDLPWFERVIEVKRVFKVSYLTVLRRLSDTSRDPAGYQRKLMMFQSAYEKRFGRKLDRLTEPCPVDFEIKAKRMLALARKDYEDQRITLSRLAEILGVGLLEAREQVARWRKDVG